MAERPTPAAVFKRLTEKKPTLFYGVPTLYAAMLADANFPKKESLALLSVHELTDAPRRG